MGTEARSEATVLVVDDDKTILSLVTLWLEQQGYSVTTLESGAACLAALAHMMPDVVCLDVSMPDMDGLETLRRIRARDSMLPVVMLTADTAVDTVVAAMSLGAYDYLVKPIDRAKLTTTIRNAVERAQLAVRLTQLEREAEGRGYAGLVGSSPAMRNLFRQLDRVAARDITVLIAGESGSGKELVARAIHENSGRAEGPFVALNCAAIPENLLESELFGYEKGAFTGAAARRVGRFEQANGGTLFLDEVGELPVGLQAKLLRAIQERAFHRVGGNSEVHTDFRLLAATHKPLEALVREGRIREDFYFRLAVFEIEVPPLRDRGTDIVVLAHHFVETFSTDHDHDVHLTPEAERMLAAYEWPGNVRELENAIHRAVVATSDALIRPEDLPPRIRRSAAEKGAVASATLTTYTAVDLPEGSHIVPVLHPDGTPMSMDEVEREVIKRAVERNQGNLTRVGKELAMGRTTLYRKLTKFGLER